jgi:hypothetical protein
MAVVIVIALVVNRYQREIVSPLGRLTSAGKSPR